MSNKSKRTPKWRRTAQRNADLLVFIWAWVSVCDPEISDILRVKAEILNVCESLAAGNLTLDMINRQLMDEFGLATDWARRDRGCGV